jgi:bacillithiol system protein YtxJ
MGFLDQFRKTRDAGLPEDWQTIESELQLQAAIDESYERPVVLFKHSVTCGISAGAKYRLEQEWDFKREELSFYYLDLLAFRSLSNKIADVLDVTHQSPQVIIINDGKAIYSTSHHMISVVAIRNNL